jgi:hypothetical protein
MPMFIPPMAQQQPVLYAMQQRAPSPGWAVNYEPTAPGRERRSVKIEQ